MPRVELKQTKGNPVSRKKSTKSDGVTTPGKSGISSSKTKKEQLTKQREAKKELNRLFTLSTTREDLNSTSEEGSGEGSDLKEGGENASDGDMRKGGGRDRSLPADDDEEEVEVEGQGERREPEKQRHQGPVESKQVPTKKKKEPQPIHQLRALDVKDRYVSAIEVWRIELRSRTCLSNPPHSLYCQPHTPSLVTCILYLTSPLPYSLTLERLSY